jgi:hypothetical protein
MKFVKPTKTVWTLTHLLQKLGFMTAVLSQMLLLHFVMPYFDLKFLPKIDHNPFIYFKERDVLKETFTYKMTYDAMLFGLFFF